MIGKQRTLILLIIAIALVGLMIPLMQFVFANKQLVLQNPLVHRIIPIYHSFRKIPDILFYPAALTHTSALERFELFISDKQQQKLNSALGENPFGSTLEPENKVWVNGDFRAAGYNDGVDVKYRGRMGNHWNSYKKSYSVEFPKDNLFRGMREIRLILPGDRLYFSESLNNYRAEKMGQLVPETNFVRLSVNGSADGVMLLSEQWSQAWVEKQPVSALSGLFGVTEFTPPGTSAYSLAGLPYWKSWNLDQESFPQLEALMELVENTSDEEFKAIAPSLIDLESFYAKDTIHLLSGGYHISDNGNNIVLFFDATEGRFKTIPYNVGILTLDKAYVPTYPRLQERIWNIPEFRAARDAYFDAYVSAHKEDDIRFIDEWIETMKVEFYKDNAKLDNNFMFLSDLERYRQSALHHLENATPSFIDEHRTGPTHLTATASPSFPSEFSTLLKSGKTPEEFVRENRQFQLTEAGIRLRGYQVINKDIVIPRDTTLTIAPGSTLVLEPGVSIISYSPVRVVGTKTLPITFKAADDTDPWGSFVVLNTNDAGTSTITYTNFENGSEERTNGVWFSGMLALHNASGVITNNTFTNVRGEDGVNVKGGWVQFTENTIDTTLSDGVDFDYITPDSIVTQNTFTNIGGDAIDLSWTEAPIINNVIDTCTDKGVSVGERSRTTVSQNTISNCDIGVAVKDQSFAHVEANTISNTRAAVSLYQKKPFFGGAIAITRNNTLDNNRLESETDPQSTLTIE